MPDRRGRRTLAATALLVAAALTVSACGDGPDPAPPGTQPTGEGARLERPELRYVALGDSYSAAPGVPQTEVADGCYRSTGNYAHLVADEADELKLVDVTCGGADTKALLKGQKTESTRLPAQISHLTPATDLVTVSIGGNDLNLFARVLSFCLAVATDDLTGSPCTDQSGAGGPEVLTTIARNVDRVLDAIEVAAPSAQVVVVGYPRLLPDRGSCPRLVPISSGDYPLINATNKGLSDILRDAAAARDLDFVDAYKATRGHDICADDPWINGARFGADGSVPYHPLAQEQKVVADLVLTRIQDLL